jgi:glycosyltransferase involved in cell wall biosynthesis
MSKPNLSIVVPCYNEEKNIPSLISAFSNAIGNENVEVIMVNNGSTDNSGDVLEKMKTQYPFISIVNIEVNEGYGHGIMTGLRMAQADILGWTHADLQTDPKDVIKAYTLFQQQTDKENCYVKGDRKGRPLFDQFFTMGMSLFESLYLNTRLWDINAQPNIFHRSFFNIWKDKAPKDFSLDLYVLYQARVIAFNIIRFDVVFPERVHGSSSWNTSLSAKWKFIARTFNFSTELKKGL